MKNLIESIYRYAFNEQSPHEEWEIWHTRTRDALRDIVHGASKPKELVDLTEIKYYSWLSSEVIELISLTEKRVENMLEVGSGSGALSLFLSQKGISDHYVLADNNETALEYASYVHRENEGKFDLVKSGATDMQFDDHSFDLVHSVGLIEHFNNETIHSMISEMCRVLTNRGLLYLAIPNYVSPEIIRLWAKYNKGSERFLTCGDMHSFIQEAGLKPIKWGHSAFAFPCGANRIISERVEKCLGKMGMGFLNYIFAQKQE